MNDRATALATASEETVPGMDLAVKIGAGEALARIRETLEPKCRKLVRALSREAGDRAVSAVGAPSVEAAARSLVASMAGLSTASGPAAAENLAAESPASGAATAGSDARFRLLQRATMGWSLLEQQRIDSLGRRQWLEEQLHPGAIDDFGLEDILASELPSIAMTPLQIVLTYGNQIQVPFFELEIATLLRSIYSPRQLHERMTVFWTDHFSIDILSSFGIYLKPTDDREVIRPRVFGRFEDLLRASAHSPAMLDYLTNDSNVAGHPNENYSRELMELHTLGADAGYTQEDVREVARCFTGWSFHQEGFQFGRFRFRSAYHDDGPKTVLGHPIPAGGGERDGNDVVSILARHEAAGRFLGGKMLRYLRGYEPTEREIERMQSIYVKTGGDLRALTRDALTYRSTAAPEKLKRPYHLVVSAVRALLAEIENPFPLLLALLSTGHLPYTWHPPNGFPDSFGYWSGLLLPRWSFGATALAGLSPNLPLAQPANAAELIDLLSGALLGGRMTPETRATLEGYLAGEPLSAERRMEALGLALGSPDFQHY